MANTEKLGSYHISSDIRNYEPAKSNHFSLIVHDLTNLLPADYAFDRDGETVANDYMQNPDEVIKLSVKSFTPPHFNVGVITIRRGNSIVKYADVPEWTEQQIELEDYLGLNTKSAIMAWQALAYDVVHDTQGRAIDYKKDCTLVEYTPDFQQVRYWELIGCWISNVSESPFEVDGSGDRKITATLQYDRAIMHMPDGQNYNKVES